MCRTGERPPGVAAGNRLDYQHVMEAQNRAIADLMKSADFPSALLPSVGSNASASVPQGMAVGFPQQVYQVQANNQQLECDGYLSENVPVSTWNPNDWAWDPVNMMARPLELERCVPNPYGMCTGNAAMHNKSSLYNEILQCDDLVATPVYSGGYDMAGYEHAQPVNQGNLLPSKPSEMKCQIEGCMADIRKLKPYHRRHRICEEHERDPEVLINGVKMRFCQMCGRVQPIEDFDDLRRTCRERLASHNRRRRAKRNPEAYKEIAKVPRSSLLQDMKKERFEPKEESIHVGDYLVPNADYPMLDSSAGQQFQNNSFAVPNMSSGCEEDSSDTSNGAHHGQGLHTSGSSDFVDCLGDSSDQHRMDKVDPTSYDPQIMNNRLLTKMMGSDPSDLPSDLRARVEEWLGESPLSSTAYIRPGCVCLTVDVTTPAVPRWNWNGKAFNEVQKEVAGGPEAWLEILTRGSSCHNRLARGSIMAQVADQISFCTDGEVVSTSSVQNAIRALEVANATMPKILDVFPRVVDGTAHNVLTLKLDGPLGNKRELICRFNGQLVPLTVLDSAMDCLLKVGMPPVVSVTDGSLIEGGVASFEILVCEGILASDSKPILVVSDSNVANEISHAATILMEDGTSDALLTDIGFFLSHAQLVSSLMQDGDQTHSDTIESLCSFWCESGCYISDFLSCSAKAFHATCLLDSILEQVFKIADEGSLQDSLGEAHIVLEETMDVAGLEGKFSTDDPCLSAELVLLSGKQSEQIPPEITGSLRDSLGLLRGGAAFLALTAAVGICIKAMGTLVPSTISKNMVLLQYLESSVSASAWVA